jgi:hypothetical protein
MDLTAADETAAKILCKDLVIERTGKEYIENSFGVVFVDIPEDIKNQQIINSRRIEQILFGQPTEWVAGLTNHFDDVPAVNLTRLITEKLWLPTKETGAELYEFILRNLEFRAYGYLTCPERGHQIIVLNGLEYSGEVTKVQRTNFLYAFADADDIEVGANRLWCYYNR